MIDPDGYRPNVGIVLLNHNRKVFWAQRVNNDGWQFPQGGMRTDETPVEAMYRELREETGFSARKIVELGWVHPNPAIQNNRCHSFLALDATRVGDPRPDSNESFEAFEVPLAEIPEWIATRRITHALVVAAFQLLRPEHLE